MIVFYCLDCVNAFCEMKDDACPHCYSGTVQSFVPDETHPDISKGQVDYMYYNFLHARPQTRWNVATRTLRKLKQTGNVQKDIWGTPTFEWEGIVRLFGEDRRITNWTASLVEPPRDAWECQDVVEVSQN